MYYDLIIYYLILFVVAIIGMVRLSKLTIPFRILAYLIIVILISEIIARVLVYTIRNSNPPYHILCILQYAGFAYIYYRLLTGHRARIYILISIIPFCILSCLNTLFFQTFFTFPSNIIMLSYIVFIIFSLLLFMQMLDQPKETAIFKQSIFWLNIAILIYSIITPVSFGVLNYLAKHNLSAEIVGNFIEYFTFLYYLTIGYSILIDKKSVPI